MVSQYRFHSVFPFHKNINTKENKKEMINKRYKSQLFYYSLVNVILPLVIRIYIYEYIGIIKHSNIKHCYWKLNWHCLSVLYSTYTHIRIIIYVNEKRIKVVVKLSRVIASLLSVSFFITVSNVIRFKYNWNQYQGVFIIKGKN